MIAFLAVVLIMTGCDQSFQVVHEVSTENRYVYSFAGAAAGLVDLTKPIVPTVKTTLILRPVTPFTGCIRPRCDFPRRAAAAYLSVAESDRLLRRLLR